LLLTAESAENEATVVAEPVAQDRAVPKQRTCRGNLVGVVVEGVGFDLDVLPTQGAAGDGGSDLEQEEWTELRLEH
jgi:hypothetical protein